MRYLIGAVSAILLIILVFIVYLYSGIYNISANDHHQGISMWMINTLKDNSIKNHTDDDIQMPDFTDSSLIREGFSHYRNMCVGCHGAPGIDPLAKGFYPQPPLLTEAAGEWTPQQLFWIIKNGIKMTSMPAFGVSHSDKTIWAIVAFTKEVPVVTKEQYQYFEGEIKKEEHVE